MQKPQRSSLTGFDDLFVLTYVFSAIGFYARKIDKVLFTLIYSVNLYSRLSERLLSFDVAYIIIETGICLVINKRTTRSKDHHMNGQFVAYYRVSRESQGRTGLGMDAQRSAITTYLNGGKWTLLASFEEVESGKKADRPELAKAIALCKQTNSKLLIAKLDRLSRDVHFLTGLEKAGIDFVCCDMPQADRFTIHIMAALAQREREDISKRTKAALAEIKGKLERGETHVGKESGLPVTALGNPNGISAERRAKGVQARILKAADTASKVAPTIKALRDGGATLQTVADRLNEMAVTTPRGSTWTPMAVKRVLDRAD